MQAQSHQPLKAALWIGVAIASFSVMAVAGRSVQVQLSSFELMFWRSLIGFVIIVALVWRGGFAQVRSRTPGLHLLRNVLHFTGQNLWFAALMLIPLAQVVALEFTMPLWVLLLAPLLLGEVLTRRKLAAALIGFAGAMVVAQPGVQPLNLGHAAALGSALGFALNMLLTRRLMRGDTVLCVLFWMTGLQTLFGLALSQIGGFTWPDAQMWPWLVLLALTGLTAHYALTSALGLAPATLVAPMEFLRLPVIAILGAWLYAEGLDPLVFLGGAVIFAANWWNLRGRHR